MFFVEKTTTNRIQQDKRYYTRRCTNHQWISKCLPASNKTTYELMHTYACSMMFCFHPFGFINHFGIVSEFFSNQMPRLGGWQFKLFFYFHPYVTWGKMNPFCLAHIFSRGWVGLKPPTRIGNLSRPRRQNSSLRDALMKPSCPSVVEAD